MGRLTLSIGALCAALGVAACGGTTKTVVKTVTASASTPATTIATAITSTTSTTTASTPSGPPDCNAAGINSTQLKEGTCVQGGQTLVIVNKAETLHLKTLDANLVGMTTHNSLSDGSGQSAIANGKFEILTITLKNKADSPQQWQNGQAGLIVGTGSTTGSNYSEDFTAENGPDQNSCLWKAGAIGSGGIQPSESVTCDVVFDVPQSASLEATGSNLVIGNFGESDYAQPTMPVGIIRTYH